ncbi:MAG: hypothetical protein EKK35_23640 [Bradyrhizobiaceae bacterium]|nr:MAG: hypothetical protein EKK35_23640 [Bradyrhizobiaceae bacterium]
MQLIASRTYPFLDTQSLTEKFARDTLVKIGENTFLLHMAADDSPNDRIIWFDSRAALLWINEEENDYGMSWE